MSEDNDIIVHICATVDPTWNKGAAIVERMSLDRAERIRELMADAWDECAQEAFMTGWIHDAGAEEMTARNPYRVRETPEASDATP